MKDLKIKAIIFDWGNVLRFYDDKKLVNKMSKHFKVEKSLFKEVELKNRLMHDFGKISTKEFIANLNDGIGKKFTAKRYYALIKKFETEKFNKEIIPLVKHLKKSYKIFILSNGSKSTRETVIKSSIKHHFDKMLFSYQVGIKKPDKKFFDILLEKTDLSYNECLLIDDRDDTCLAARKYGMNSIVFKNNKQLKKDLISLGIKVD